jgi:hypothetical protein
MNANKNRFRTAGTNVLCPSGCRHVAQKNLQFYREDQFASSLSKSPSTFSFSRNFGCV